MQKNKYYYILYKLIYKHFLFLLQICVIYNLYVVLCEIQFILMKIDHIQIIKNLMKLVILTLMKKYNNEEIYLRI